MRVLFNRTTIYFAMQRQLHIDTDRVHTEEEWAELYAQALWLEKWRIKNLAELIAALFGESKR